MASARDIGLTDLLERAQADDEEFRAEWLRLAPARQFAAMLVGYRADHRLSQRALAKLLRVSQPRIARLESGEQNPDFETIVAVVGRLGTEFVLDVAPCGADTRLVTKAARTAGSVVQGTDVAVVTAASPARSKRSRARADRRTRRPRPPARA